MADGRQVTAVIVSTWIILLVNAGNSWFYVQTFLETLAEYSPAMAQCTENAFEFIQSAFCPMVAVMCSEDVEKVCQKNNLSFVEMVRPFCHLTSEGNFIEITASWGPIRLLFDCFVSNLLVRKNKMLNVLLQVGNVRMYNKAEAIKLVKNVNYYVDSVITLFLFVIAHSSAHLLECFLYMLWNRHYFNG